MLKYLIFIFAIVQVSFGNEIDDLRNEFKKEISTLQVQYQSEIKILKTEILDFQSHVKSLEQSNDILNIRVSELQSQINTFLNQGKATEEERLDKLEQESRAYGNYIKLILNIS